LKKAAAQGNAEAAYLLGACYDKGWGVDSDIETAKEWYQKAADNGDEDAKAALSRLDAE
jgi:TPR repeat protein